MTAPTMLVIGLDSMAPSLVFGHCAEHMPFLSSLQSRSRFGTLRSTDPPVTSPAWISMTTGRTPGELGIYGFRKSVRGTRSMDMVHAGDVRFPRIWDLADQAGQRSVVVSVPVTWPPSAGADTSLLSCFLTPSSGSSWAAGCVDRRAIEERFGPYQVDVEGFRGGNRHTVLQQCRDLTMQHFAIFRYLMDQRRPHFAMLVDMGPDRFHHSCLRHVMPSHPAFSPLSEAMAYYRLLDTEIEKTCRFMGSDTTVLLVSDHGVKPLMGAFAINSFLIREGFLVLRGRSPQEPTPLSRTSVDWSRTVAFAEGGYHARVFVNRTDRFADGVVAPLDVPKVIARLRDRLSGIRDDDGRLLQNRVHTADTLYGSGAVGMPPDLTVYVDDLNLRAAGTVGHRELFLAENDTGADDANHDYDGFYLLHHPAMQDRREARADILDVFATAMTCLELTPPDGCGGKALC